MIHKFHAQDIEKGEKIVKSQGIKNIVFSQNTYQVEVDDLESSDTTWVFIQLDGNSKIQDCFCTCLKAEYTQSCCHLCAGAIAIFSGSSTPLHLNYENSFFSKVFFLIARRYGFNPGVLLETENNLYTLDNSDLRAGLSIKLISQEASEKLQELLKKPEENEDNSIKFSNLNSEELSNYRKGVPSIGLQFELSFWSDFSKWIFFRVQQKNNIKVSVLENEEKVPTYLIINTADVELKVFLSTVNWKEVLYNLKDYLPVFDFFSFKLEKITYNKQKKEFILYKKPTEISKIKDQLIDLDSYYYIPNSGFYPKEDDEIFLSNIIKEQDISFFLKKHINILQKYLEGDEIQQTKKSVKYDLFFDAETNFHIHSYFDKKEDINRPEVGIFLPYIYTPEYGFFQISDLQFDSLKKIINKEKMTEFIEHFKHWLNQHDGFQIHLNSIESALTYELLDDSTLHFFTRDQSKLDRDLIDLQDWCYLKNYGFFPKGSPRNHSNIRSGTNIAKESIASFIDQNTVELEGIHGFFSTRTPLKNLGLKVYLNDENMIVIEPKMEFHFENPKGKVLIFETYGFLKNYGFFPLKDGFSLPKGYEEKKIIPLFLEEQFLHFEWNQIQKYIIECDHRLKRIESSKFIVDSVKEEQNKKFMIKIYYETAHGRISLSELFDPVVNNKPYVMTDAGLIYLDTGHFDFLKTLGKKSYNKTSKELKVSFLEWIKLSSFMHLEFSPNCNREELEKLKNIDILNPTNADNLPNLAGFQSNLRPYQKIGLRWLWHLYNYDLSGILADDMGLGKTHQAMSLLAACSNKGENLNKKYLVVCPTSVIYHWQNLLNNFLPNLKVKMFYGTNRSITEFEESSDLLLTSYGTLRSDIKELSKLKFEVAVLDEMHVAKNQQSQIHKSLKKIQAHMKLGLTGTPIENDLSELKALFDVVLPQYFPDAITFKEQFIYPIEKFDDLERKKLLKKMIMPFILRRKKTEVLSDLPEKIEEISYIDLSEEQKVLYQQIVNEKNLKAEDVEEEKSLYLHIFQLFNKLKQLCNHPALVLQDIENYKNYSSGKFELFKELIAEARNSKQKVVVFSQYLGMLEIFRLYLDEEKIKYAGIQGNTKDRKEQIEKFKVDPDCEVFLASLQAAGVGIDLVSASIVIHYDRWWNPAKENQATDRVHRIGQTRGVQVFKFVSKDTIEEHIHDMILKKLELASSIVGYDEELEMKRIDKEELMSLLKLVHKDLKD